MVVTDLDLDFEKSMIQLFVKWFMVSMTETEHDGKACNAGMKWGKGVGGRTLSFYLFYLFVNLLFLLLFCRVFPPQRL